MIPLITNSVAETIFTHMQPHPPFECLLECPLEITTLFISMLPLSIPSNPFKIVYTSILPSPAANEKTQSKGRKFFLLLISYGKSSLNPNLADDIVSPLSILCYDKKYKMAARFFVFLQLLGFQTTN